MCKVLALLALLANSNAKASASASTVVGTASAFSTAVNTVPTHSDEYTLISFSMVAMDRAFSIASGSLLVFTRKYVNMRKERALFQLDFTG